MLSATWCTNQFMARYVTGVTSVTHLELGSPQRDGRVDK